MTDGTEHLPGATAPGPAASSGYGYRPPQPYPPEPDWAAMADRNESLTRRRKFWVGGGMAVVGVIGVAAGTLALTGGDSGRSKAGTTVAAAVSPSAGSSASPATTASASPSASGSPSASASLAASPGAPAPHSSTGPAASAPAAGGAAAAPPPTRAPVTTPTVPGNPNALADHSGQADLALSAEAGLKAVSGGYALSLKGSTGGYAQSSGRVVDTGRGFTVSAWIYSDAADGSRTAISDGDGTSSVFDLGRDDSGGQKAWVFRVQTADGGTDATTVQVRSASSTTASQWTLLTGSYDASQHTVTLYVNGAPAGSAKVSGICTDRGPLELGRSRQNGAWARPWAGVIGHIQVWDRALSSSEVAAVKSSGGAGAGARPVASWLV